MEKTTGVGARLEPDQKGSPDEAIWSRGKLNSSWEMESKKSSWNLSRAQWMHSSNARGRAVTSESMRPSSTSTPPGLVVCSRANTPAADCRYWLTWSGALAKRPPNTSRAHSMVCSIWLGKFLRVQMGMDFSGGSRDEPYDSVRWGTTTWMLPLVDSVPDSSSGLP